LKKIILIGLVIIFASCGTDPYLEGDFFYLVNKHASMPVVVRGNKASEIFILFIHGGPGGTALQKIGLAAFDGLEKSYATVFWDQRGSGSSQGNNSAEDLTLSQFVEDLDKLIDLIRFRYHDPQIFLMGHSWGGCLGTAYLTDATRQRKIRGWIEVDGAHDNPDGDNLSLAWITAYAETQIAAKHDTEFWKYALDWYAKNPNFTSDQLEHYTFLEKAHGYIFDSVSTRDPKAFPVYSFNYVFKSPADLPAALTNYNHVIKKFIVSDIDLTNEMKKITLPSLIIWGEHDGVIPYPMAQQALLALGTTAADKNIFTLPSSAHYGYYEEPVLFEGAVRSFIEKYK
jgi:proline iminopeptidase